MKKLQIIGTAIFLILITSQLMAQPPKPENEKQRAKRFMKEMASSIDDLTPKQRQDLKAIHQKYHPEMKAIKEEARAKKEAGRKEIKPKLRAIHQKINGEVSLVLNEEQMSQYTAFHEKKKEERMARRKERRQERSVNE